MFGLWGGYGSDVCKRKKKQNEKQQCVMCKVSVVSSVEVLMRNDTFLITVDYY